MKRLLFLFFLLALVACRTDAQTFSGRAGSDIFVTQPFRLCLGEDNGSQICFTQSAANIAKLSNGQFDFAMVAQTVATLPSASLNTGRVYRVTDGTSSSDCTIGGGTTSTVCFSDGAGWKSIGGTSINSIFSSRCDPVTQNFAYDFVNNVPTCSDDYAVNNSVLLFPGNFTPPKNNTVQCVPTLPCFILKMAVGQTAPPFQVQNSSGVPVFNIGTTGGVTYDFAQSFAASRTNLFGNAIESAGTLAGLSGTGACATITTQLGGSWSGSFKCTTATAASTVVITPGGTAPNGWSCSASDITAGTTLSQSAYTTTTCTVKQASITQNDVLTFTANYF